MGLGQRLDHYPGQLSGGEQQRVAPGAGPGERAGAAARRRADRQSDRSTGRQIAELIFAARERHGATLFLITHDPTLASLCDETRAMRDGRLDAGDIEAGAFAGASS
ncbi:MAG: hypothetical protein R3D28_25235 [Geminicoccaceae bacterium]